MFWHQGAADGERLSTEVRAGLTILVFNQLPEDGTLMPKHVVVGT
jgi:hypothetical protein